MWLIADYQSVGLFSLKSSLATSSGAKSLLIPTPYAIKMALLDAACRCWGVPEAQTIWPIIRDLPIALRLPKRAVVTNLFAKILKPRRSPAKPGMPDSGPFGKTIAFREYVWLDGDMGVACSLDESHIPRLTELFAQINYLGKRGSFVQLMGSPWTAAELPGEFVLLNPPGNPDSFPNQGFLQMLDDCGPDLSFDHVNIYSGTRLSLGKDRIFHHIILPYRLARSSKGYTLYERIDG